jgi:flagellar basal-body rod modification protein FlgD
MADIASVANSTSSTSSSSALSQTKALGKDEFFKLLLAQLKNQDPLNPQDGAAFSAQLAQFSSLEQLTNINTALTAQNLNYTNLLNAQAVNLIGKEVTARQIDASDASLTTTITGQVSAVQFKDKAIYLTVNGQEIAFSDVTSVK